MEEGDNFVNNTRANAFSDYQFESKCNNGNDDTGNDAQVQFKLKNIRIIRRNEEFDNRNESLTWVKYFL